MKQEQGSGQEQLGGPRSKAVAPGSRFALICRRDACGPSKAFAISLRKMHDHPKIKDQDR
jgi:hypothetical protein